MSLKSIVSRSSAPILLFDGLALGIYWYLIPSFKRPLDGLLAVIAVLGALTAIIARHKTVQNAAVITTSLAASFFLLEMGQRYFHIMDRIPRPGKVSTPEMLGNGGEYAWVRHDPVSYSEAKERGRRDGIDPEALTDDFSGNIYEGMDSSKLRLKRDQILGKTRVITLSESPRLYFLGPPLGAEFVPDVQYWTRCTDVDGKYTVYDAPASSNSFGLRTTRCDEQADETYIFVGCSFTYGSYLADHQTAAHGFSEAFGFTKRVLNLGMGNYGPHQSLRDLELDYHTGKAVVDAAGVRGVFFTLIDDHARRVVTPSPEEAPRYVLENGRAVFKGSYSDTRYMSRWEILLTRSRIYPALRSRFNANLESDSWELTVAILKAMDDLCRERYNVPLTVVYWDGTPEVLRKVREAGIDAVDVGEILGEDWRAMAIKYLIFDGHPSPHGNKMVGRHLHERATAGKEEISDTKS